MNFRHSVFVGIWLLLASGSAAAEAERSSQLPVLEPKICTGQTPNGWGPVRAGECPRDHAFFSQCCRPGGVPYYAGGDRVTLSGVCCPLPSEDILQHDEPTVRAREQCPENYLVTGGLQEDCPECRYFLICSKINTARFQLAPGQPGIAWGISSSQWKIPRLISRGELPLGIRYGVGREGKYRFANSGCVASVPGHVLVGRRSKRCRNYYFSELQYAGLPGDPPRGTPVRMFPDCQMLSDPFEDTPRCHAP